MAMVHRIARTLHVYCSFLSVPGSVKNCWLDNNPFSKISKVTNQSTALLNQSTATEHTVLPTCTNM